VYVMYGLTRTLAFRLKHTIAGRPMLDLPVAWSQLYVLSLLLIAFEH
jgi:hypothetical protein